jgi:ribosome recycling factor
MSADEYISGLSGDMDKALDAFRREISGVRTGRALPALIEHVPVEVSAYGSTMPLKQLGNITAPDARLLVVTTWDKTVVTDIVHAIQKAGLGLNPQVDGQLIRVPIPALTGDRRKELIKQVGRIAEEGRVRIRNVRREYNELLKALHDDKDITEDELKRSQEKVQKSTDAYIKQLDELAAKKEKEVSEV